jgi:disulfide bond formation protein DsbB
MNDDINPLVLLVWSAATLTVVFTMQYGFGLDPCPLCTLQRIPYGIAEIWALMAIFTRDARIRGFLLLVLGVTFIGSILLAFYHSGVEWKWWESACTMGTAPLADSPEQLLLRLSGGGHPVACDIVRFRFLGLTLANFNLVASFGLTIYSFWAASKAFKEQA